MTHKEREAIERRILAMREEKFNETPGSALPAGTGCDVALTPEQKRWKAAMYRSEQSARKEQRLAAVRRTMDLDGDDAARATGLHRDTVYRLRRQIREARS